MNSIGTRDIRLRLAISKPLECFLALVGSELRRTAETDSAGLGTTSALACASTDETRASRPPCRSWDRGLAGLDGFRFGCIEDRPHCDPDHSPVHDHHEL